MSGAANGSAILRAIDWTRFELIKKDILTYTINIYAKNIYTKNIYTKTYILDYTQDAY